MQEFEFGLRHIIFIASVTAFYIFIFTYDWYKRKEDLKNEIEEAKELTQKGGANGKATTAYKKAT